MTTVSATTSSLRVCLCIGISSLIMCSLSVKASEDTMQAVAKAWKKRQERIRSAEFTWTESRLHTRGSAPFTKEENPHDRPKDISYDTHHRVIIDDEKIRYSYDGKIWNENGTDVEDMNHVSVFDGQRPKHLDKGAGLKHPIGAIIQGRRSSDVGQLQNLPILAHYRGVHPTLSPITLDNYLFTGERVIVKERLCVVLKERPSGRNGVNSIYVDPERDYSIMRYSSAINGNTVGQLDLKYSSDPSHGWVPASWEFIMLSPKGMLQQHSKSSVSSVKINHFVPPDTFQLDFPVGTMVTDQRAKDSNGLPVRFLVKPDGTERIIRENELMVPYEQLMQDESRGLLASRWFIFINLFVLITTVGFFLWKYLKKMRRTTLPS